MMGARLILIFTDQTPASPFVIDPFYRRTSFSVENKRPLVLRLSLMFVFDNDKCIHLLISPYSYHILYSTDTYCIFSIFMISLNQKLVPVKLIPS